MQVFVGNINQFESSQYNFEPRLITRFVRIYVKLEYYNAALSLELYGCDIPELAHTRDVGKYDLQYRFILLFIWSIKAAVK